MRNFNFNFVHCNIFLLRFYLINIFLLIAFIRSILLWNVRLHLFFNNSARSLLLFQDLSLIFLFLQYNLLKTIIFNSNWIILIDFDTWFLLKSVSWILDDFILFIHPYFRLIIRYFRSWWFRALDWYVWLLFNNFFAFNLFQFWFFSWIFLF